jgi:hypothetical protein
LFEKQNLEKLKGLYFDINEPKQKVKFEEDEDQLESPELAGNGDE